MSAAKRLTGLDGLRAIAALIILVIHVYQVAGKLGNVHFWSVYEQLYYTGRNMVTLLFVLSGFVITHVLLQEKEKTGTISLARFYKKRILRIWPVYFLLFLAVFALSRFTGLYSSFGTFNIVSSLYIIFFCVNIGNISSAPLVVLPHYWSLSVEVQFYLLGPYLFRKIKPLPICLFVLVMQVLLKNMVGWLSVNVDNRHFWVIINSILGQSLFSCMAIGGIFAVAFHERWKILGYLKKPLVRIHILVLSILLSCLPISIPYVHDEALAVVFGAFMIITVSGGAMLLGIKPLRYLGEISYGIYMYHWPLAALLVYCVKLWRLPFFFDLYGLPIVISTLLLTVVFAHLSFLYMETPFLRLKNRYANNKPEKLKKTVAQ